MTLMDAGDRLAAASQVRDKLMVGAFWRLEQRPRVSSACWRHGKRDRLVAALIGDPVSDRLPQRIPVRVTKGSVLHIFEADAFSTRPPTRLGVTSFAPLI